MKSPLVSIIIINWNGGEVFKQCLDSLAEIKYPNWELILVDNGSVDGSEMLPEKLKVKSENLPAGKAGLKVIKNKTNLGFAKANNQGFKISRGKYILLLNNDTKVKPDFLSNLVRRMIVDNSVGVIQPKIYLMDKPGILDNVGSFMTRIGFLTHLGFGEKDGPQFEKEQEIFSAKGACMLLRKEVIEEVGFFDSDFFSYFEESDFCWRVWMGGWRVLFFPDAVIYHKLGFTIRRLDVSDLNFHYYKNRMCSLLKNLEFKNLSLIFTPHLLISLSLMLLFLSRGQVKYSLMIGKAITWNIWNLPQTFKKRRKIQKMRKLDDRELFKLILRPINWTKFFGDFRRLEEDLKRKN